jgi:hypothetical protein
VSTVRDASVADRFLDALSRRDFDGLAATFTVNGRLRGLVPAALREAEGREAIAERFRIWNADIEDFRLVDTATDGLEDVLRIRWRVRGIDPDDGLSVYEQTAYAGIEGDAIAWMNLVCSGARQLQE